MTESLEIPAASSSGRTPPGWAEKGVGAGVEGNPELPPEDIPSSTFRRCIPAANCSGWTVWLVRPFSDWCDREGECGVWIGVAGLDVLARPSSVPDTKNNCYRVPGVPKSFSKKSLYVTNSEKTRESLFTLQISLQFDDFFWPKCFKILISCWFEIFTKTCLDTLYISNVNSYPSDYQCSPAKVPEWCQGWDWPRVEERCQVPVSSKE